MTEKATRNVMAGPEPAEFARGEWDEELWTLVIRGTREREAGQFEFILPLNDLMSCEQRLSDIWNEGQDTTFRLNVMGLAAREEFATHLSQLAWILIRLSRKQRPNRKAWHDLACEILTRLELTSIDTAWHLRFVEAGLTVDERFELLEGSLRAMVRPQDDGQVNVYNAEITDEKQRELYWWMNICLFELAVIRYDLDWSSSPQSIQRLRQASYNYVHLLDNEPYRQHLERFLRNSGSDVATEIQYVLWLSDELRPLSRAERVVSPAVEEDKLNGVFIPWFLKRYDWRSAFRLWWHTHRTGPNRLSDLRLLILTLLPLIGFTLLTLSAPPSALMEWLRSTFGARIDMWGLWILQVALQAFVLTVFFTYYQSTFRILAPRAFFASLLGFSGIFLAHRDITETHLGGADLFSSCRDFITGCGEGCSHWCGMEVHLLGCAGGCLFLMIPALLVAGILIMHQVASLLPDGQGWGRRLMIVLSRTILFGIFCYFGAFFWGILFAFPLVMLCSDHKPDFLPLWEVAFVSSAYALMFGFLVQLLWEDRSAAEPMLDPL